MASYGPVERAVRAELRSLDFSVATDGASAAAVALAKAIDTARGAVAAAQAANVLRVILEDLRKRADERPREGNRLELIRSEPASAGRADASPGVAGAGGAVGSGRARDKARRDGGASSG